MRRHPAPRLLGSAIVPATTLTYPDPSISPTRGREAVTNFSMDNYEGELANIQGLTKDELILSLRRQSKGFSRGSSKYRGVTRHQKGKWEARIGSLVGKKYHYLGESRGLS